jgi:DNA mismatch repair protein MutS
MPASIVERANQILADLEGSANTAANTNARAHLGETREGMQLSFFQLDDPVLEQIRDEVTALDINNLTPLEALNKLSEIKRLVGGK